jgi:UDP-N-acetyl-2-amino-2-deoxyglucuronate dehydrogenase
VTGWKIGILGGGGISDTHARAAAEIPGVEVVAVCGENREKVARLAGRHGAAAYDDMAAFLRHRSLDVVAIGSPSGCHAEQAIACARAGLHVLVEKPLAISTAEVDGVVAACDAAGVKLGVFFQDRLQPDFVRLRAFLARGGLGRVHLATAHVKWYRPPDYYSGSRWRGRLAHDGGGAVMNQGIHTLDLLLHLLGDVRCVHGLTRPAVHAIEVEDTAVALLEMASGALVTYEASTAAFPGYKRRLEISGEQGTLGVEHDRVVAADLRPGSDAFPVSAPAATAESASSPLVSDATPHRRVFEDFLGAIRAGRRPVCDGPEGRRSVAVVEALYASARTGAPVSLPRA